MSAPLSPTERNHRVGPIFPREEVKNGKFQVPNGDLESSLKNYDCYQAIRNGLTACFSNETRQFVVLDPQGRVITSCKAPKKPTLELMDSDKKANADTWKFNETVPYFFVEKNIYFTLESGGKFPFNDIYCFDESNKCVKLFQQCVVEPKFYQERMLTGRSSKSYSHVNGTTYKLYNLVTKVLVTQIDIPPGNLPSAEMGPAGIKFTGEKGTIAYYDYEGRKINE